MESENLTEAYKAHTYSQSCFGGKKSSDPGKCTENSTADPFLLGGAVVKQQP